MIGFFGIELEDSITRLYRYAYKRDEKEIEESVRSQKVTNLEKAIDSKKDNETQKRIKIEVFLNELALFDTDKKYNKEQINKYIKQAKFKVIIRKFRILGEIFLNELFQLSPLIVLLLTNNIFYAIISSGIVMVIFSMFQEQNLSKNMEYLYGKEASDEIMSENYTKLIIIITSFLKQMYFYILLFLI